MKHEASAASDDASASSVLGGVVDARLLGFMSARSTIALHVMRCPQPPDVCLRRKASIDLRMVRAANQGYSRNGSTERASEPKD